ELPDRAGDPAEPLLRLFELVREALWDGEASLAAGRRGHGVAEGVQPGRAGRIGTAPDQQRSLFGLQALDAMTEVGREGPRVRVLLPLPLLRRRETEAILDLFEVGLGNRRTAGACIQPVDDRLSPLVDLDSIFELAVFSFERVEFLALAGREAAVIF